MGLPDPLFRRENETVEPGLFSKPVELDGIKIRVVELFPDTEKFDGVAVPDPFRGDRTHYKREDIF